MKKISLFGYGKTTKAIAKKNKNAIFYDDNVLKSFKDENGFFVKPSSEFDANNSQIEIPSPGIPPYNPLIKKAKNIMSEYDFFASDMPFSIWISGTNGKTTTTQMMQHILKDKGSQEGGNIGTPLAELDTDADMWILETSSFTMHYTNIAKPNIYVLLPLSPDHISWHGNMQEYINAKLKPLKQMKEGEVAIIPKAYSNIETDAFIVSYEDENELAEYFDIDTQKIKFKGAFLVDAILAMAVDKVLFDRIDYDKINAFAIDPHRQEELNDKQNRLWVNDTKATNIDATIAALNRYKDFSICLILGGDDKGVELDELFEYLKTINDIKIYTIGSNKEKLCNLAKKYNISFRLCKNLVDAVKTIDKDLSNGKIALLSPAASSLDEFKSYAHRGNLFKETVFKLS